MPGLTKLLRSVLLISLAVLFLPGSRTVSAQATTTFHRSIYLPVLVQPSNPEWLRQANFYRSTANLPPLIENETLSYGNRLHAQYMIKNGALSHDEVPGNRWYTPEGQKAARSSNLAGQSDPNASDTWAVDTWMQAPFHALGILDPELVQVGYGSYREAGAGLQMAAALNILQGRSSRPIPAAFPIVWPGDGQAIPLLAHWGETPDPLTSCPGYQAPAGLPLIVQMGWGEGRPEVTASQFSQGGKALEHCILTESTYTNPDQAQQALARTILDGRDAIILIPRAPLEPGKTYSAAITVDGRTYRWEFETLKH